MVSSVINIEVIPQLRDNYSYILHSLENNFAVILDPAESESIIHFIKKNNLSIEAILITHHHNDHTAGIIDLLNYKLVPVYSPNINIKGTTKVVYENKKINLSFLEFSVLKTPGHTLDHIIFYEHNNNLLFSGDTLFRLGCGRVFEGTYDQMIDSLKKIEKLDDSTQVYCGHEYTLRNLEFLQSLFHNNKSLDDCKKKIINQISKTKRSVPFLLGEEKKLNPFLSSKSSFYVKFMQNKGLNSSTFFKFIRDLKNDF